MVMGVCVAARSSVIFSMRSLFRPTVLVGYASSWCITSATPAMCFPVGCAPDVVWILRVAAEVITIYSFFLCIWRYSVLVFPELTICVFCAESVVSRCLVVHCER